MPTADWKNEKIPGSPIAYGDSSIQYDDTRNIDGAGQMTYDQLGAETVWTNESI